MICMTVVYLVQHGQKEQLPGDPGLTDLGRRQATHTGRWLSGLGVGSLWTSPMRRARETADCIASVTGLAVRPDARLRERLNWDGGMSFDAFLAVRDRTTRDRDLVPERGQSSRQAAARLQAFLADMRALPWPAATVTHGGITIDLLRDLLGEDGLPPGLLAAGIPACAVTAVDDLNAVMIASVSHFP
jgi:broad specificity phosphatase PhoE